MAAQESESFHAARDNRVFVSGKEISGEFLERRPANTVLRRNAPAKETHQGT
jgi:hypothetical protein